jgi:hypothetical protein
MDKLELIETALRKLPVIPGHESVIRGFAMEINCASMVAESFAVPMTQDSTKKQAVDELLVLLRKVVDLREHLFAMRSNAVKACEAVTVEAYQTVGFDVPDRPILHALDEQLVAATKMLPCAIMELRMDESRGPDKKRGAALITESVKRAYVALTGKSRMRQSRTVLINRNTEATKEAGALLALLTEIFDILGVDAKPAGQVRRLSKK